MKILLFSFCKIMTKSYTELSKLPTFEERFRYLKLKGNVGEESFGFDRYINQQFYRSRAWKDIRNKVIVRDNGCDLGIEDRPIVDKVIIHHMNAMTLEDLKNRNSAILNPEYLICVSEETHRAIHYGDENQIQNGKPTERKPNDTCPWK